MNCRIFRENILEYQDAKPEDPLVREMKQHLEVCPDCSGFLLQWQWVSRLAKGLPRVEAPGDFEIRLRKRLREEQAEVRSGWFSFIPVTWRYAMVGAMSLCICFSALYLYQPGGGGGSIDRTASQAKAIPVEPGQPQGERPDSAVEDPGAYPAALPVSTRTAGYGGPRNPGEWPPDIEVHGEGGEYVEYLLKGTGQDEIVVRMPKTIRVRPPGENDPSYFRYISH